MQVVPSASRIWIQTLQLWIMSWLFYQLYYLCKMIFLPFCHYILAIVATVFEPSNFRLWVNCSYRCATSAGKVKLILFVLMQIFPSASRIWIQTLQIRIDSQLFYQLYYFCWQSQNDALLSFHQFLEVSTAAGFKPFSWGSWYHCYTNCTTSAGKAKMTIFLFSQNFLLVPAISEFKPSKLGLSVNCSNNCTTSAGKVKMKLFYFPKIFF